MLGKVRLPTPKDRRTSLREIPRLLRWALKNARYADAERVYREDLAKWPNNGWSLYGLSRALQRQGKMQEASRIEREYDRVWARADEPTTTSCKCIPKT